MAPPSKFSLTQQAINSPKANLVNPDKKILKIDNPETLSKTKIDLPDNIEVIKEEASISPNELYITKQLPKEVAILHIYQNGQDEYSVWGGNTTYFLAPTKANEKPNISLGNMVQNGKLPENIQDDIKYFSHVNVEIRKWLKQLKRQFNERLCLVIADHTNFEIPWEMLELSPYEYESPYEYVGALITTVRWRQIIRGDDYLFLEFQDNKCCGHTAAYVLDTELKGVGAELNTFKKLQARIYRSSQHNIKDFQAYLQQNESNCAFIYISCHGTYQDNLKDIALGSDNDETQQLKLLSLRKSQLNLLKNSQGIVFINACHSGREQAHYSIPHSYRMGFVELFLAKGARGVIGTLGAIGDIHAATFASELIEESLKSPTTPVAVLLRKLRLQVVQNLPEQPTTQDLLPFIYTFMYVYYGNPMTVLQLAIQGGQTDA